MTAPLTNNTQIYAGSSLTLICGIEIDFSADIPYRVSVIWLKSGNILVPSNRVTISNVSDLSLYQHEATLSVSPLSSVSDTGTYTCQATASPVSVSGFIQGATQSDVETIIVQGTYIAT